MIQEAETFAEEDSLTQKKTESRNAFENRKSRSSFSCWTRADVMPRWLQSSTLSRVKSPMPKDSEASSTRLTSCKFLFSPSLVWLLADLLTWYLPHSISTINDELKKAQDWLEEFSSSANAEDFDEQREALQAVVSPITSKLYEGGDGDMPAHDEL